MPIDFKMKSNMVSELIARLNSLRHVGGSIYHIGDSPISAPSLEGDVKELEIAPLNVSH